MPIRHACFARHSLWKSAQSITAGKRYIAYFGVWTYKPSHRVVAWSLSSQASGDGQSPDSRPFSLSYDSA